MSHTPGPWRVDDAFGLIMSGDVEVAACHAGRGGDAKANARLIVVAPELLEIVHLARGFVEVQIAEAKHFGDVSGTRDCEAALKKIDDVLARAEEP